MVSCPQPGRFGENDMKALSAAEQNILTALGNLFYETVPQNLRTYCSLTSEISKRVLQHFKVEATVVPCQLWCATSDHNYAIGFVGNAPVENKWDGHVICAAKDWFIDAAVHHIQAQFGISVPQVVVAHKFLVPTQAISRLNLNDSQTLWWYQPPPGADTSPPENPQELVSDYASQLIERLQARLTH
jgi:hypothetical protein